MEHRQNRLSRYSATCPSVAATASPMRSSHAVKSSPHFSCAASSESHALQQPGSVQTSASGWASFRPAAS